MKRSDRDRGARGIDCNAAAIGVVERDNVIDMRKSRKQFAADSLNGVTNNARDALHGVCYCQNISGADAPVAVSKTLKRIPGQRLDRSWRLNFNLQTVEHWSPRRFYIEFIDPPAGGNGLRGVADNGAIAPDRIAGRKRRKCNLVGLRHATLNS